MRTIPLAALLVVFEIACGGRALIPTDGGQDLSISTPDAPCPCQSNQLLRIGACIPTTRLGCGNGYFVPGPCRAPGTICGPGLVCDECAGTVSCWGSPCLAGCIPTAERALRIEPTRGPAGHGVIFTIRGRSFNGPPAFFVVKIGGEAFREYPDFSQGECTLRTHQEFVPAKPGIYPVEVSQSGGAEPFDLAGFYVALSQGSGAALIQPGFPCRSGGVCAEADPFSCQCSQGRCQCR